MITHTAALIRNNNQSLRAERAAKTNATIKAACAKRIPTGTDVARNEATCPSCIRMVKADAEAAARMAARKY